MKFQKTPTNKRANYTYKFSEGKSVTLTPGKDGVTEAFIKCLHAYDDSEVYSNLKSNSYIIENEDYDPTDPENNKKNHRIWTSSFDNVGLEGEEINPEKNTLQLKASKAGGISEFDRLLLAESISNIAKNHLSPKQQTILTLMYEGYLQKDIAKALDVSPVAICKQQEKIKTIFEKYFLN